MRDNSRMLTWVFIFVALISAAAVVIAAVINATGNKSQVTFTPTSTLELISTPTPTPRINELVTVYAYVRWTDSGVFIQKDDLVNISHVSGLWGPSAGNVGDGWDCDSPYYPDGLMPTAPGSSLIARIENNPPFCVGASPVFKSQYSGNLYFSYNDCESTGCFGDNVGSLVLKVIVTSSASATSERVYLIKEDFEDNNIQMVGFSSGSSKWKIVMDETGNRVYEVDNQNGSDYPSVSFGSPDWEDYVVEYRVRFLDSKGYIGLQFRSDSYTYYVSNLSMEELYLASSINGTEWARISTTFPPIQINIWHTIRVEALGNQISIYVDDALWINESDNRIPQGGLLLFGEPNTYAQVDDINVWQLENK